MLPVAEGKLALSSKPHCCLGGKSKICIEKKHVKERVRNVNGGNYKAQYIYMTKKWNEITMRRMKMMRYLSQNFPEEWPTKLKIE